MPILLRKIIENLIKRPELVLTIWNIISQLIDSDEKNGKSKEEG